MDVDHDAIMPRMFRAYSANYDDPLTLNKCLGPHHIEK